MTVILQLKLLLGLGVLVGGSSGHAEARGQVGSRKDVDVRHRSCFGAYFAGCFRFRALGCFAVSHQLSMLTLGYGCSSPNETLDSLICLLLVS